MPPPRHRRARILLPTLGALVCISGSALAQNSAESGTVRAPDSPTPTPSAQTTARADQAFEAGVAAYQRGDYAGARESFTLAYELDATYRNAAVLGQTEEKLGQLPQAATLLHWSLNRLDAHVAPESKARIAADLTLLQGRVLTLDFVTPVAFEEVLIDDLLFSANSLRILSHGPNTWRIYLEPTEHEVTVRATGYHSQQRKVGGTPGTSLDWELRWQQVSIDNTVPQPKLSATDATVSPLVTEDHPEASAWQLPRRDHDGQPRTLDCWIRPLLATSVRCRV